MLAVIAACMALVPLCPNLALLVLVFAVMGASEGSLDAGGNTLLVWLYPVGLGPWMNGLHFFFGVGAFLSPLIIAAIIGEGATVAHAYWALAALMLPPMLWLLHRPCLVGGGRWRSSACSGLRCCRSFATPSAASQATCPWARC